jgi:hypothetical protein
VLRSILHGYLSAHNLTSEEELDASTLKEAYGYLDIDIPVTDPYVGYTAPSNRRRLLASTTTTRGRKLLQQQQVQQQPLIPKNSDVFIGMWWNTTNETWTPYIFSNISYNSSSWLVSCKVSLLSLMQETLRYEAQIGLSNNGSIQHKFAAFLVLSEEVVPPDTGGGGVNVGTVAAVTVVGIALISGILYLGRHPVSTKKPIPVVVTPPPASKPAPQQQPQQQQDKPAAKGGSKPMKAEVNAGDMFHGVVLSRRSRDLDMI